MVEPTEHAQPDRGPRLRIRGARLLGVADQVSVHRGEEMESLSIVPRGDVWIEDGRIVRIDTDTNSDAGLAVGESDDRPFEIIDASGRVLMPAFVDCHTHACWAGDRLDEWQLKLQGEDYLQRLKLGGGIMATVRAVRAASLEELTDQLLHRLDAMLIHGTTCVEVKSGYGLRTDAELKMLRAIRLAAERWPGRVVPTACLGHALDPEVDREEFIARTIDETLPEVSREFPGIAIDAYCEEGAWSLEECLRLFDRADQLGHPVRVHADQFHDLGMIPSAVSRGYVSVDHLEASRPEHLKQLGSSRSLGIFGVMLPCCGFHLDQRYANGRGLIDAGGALALATNYNPGSAPCGSMPMVIALAVRHLGVRVNEAIVATTVNPAALLNLDAGVIRTGGRADLVLLRHEDERHLAYDFGSNPVAMVICNGRIAARPGLK